MPFSRRRRSEELALLALLGASVGAAVWLASRWRARQQRWLHAREASSGLALQSGGHLPIEDEAERRSGHSNGHYTIFSS